MDHYYKCGGRQQSPIDIVMSDALIATGKEIELGDYMTFHSPTDLYANHTGHAVVVEGKFSTISVQHYDYDAIRIELHMPSEHAINGRLAEGELQIVHKKIGLSSGLSQRRLGADNDASPDLVIVSVLFQDGGDEASALLNKIGYLTSFSVMF